MSGSDVRSALSVSPTWSRAHACSGIIGRTSLAPLYLKRTTTDLKCSVRLGCFSVGRPMTKPKGQLGRTMKSDLGFSVSHRHINVSVPSFKYGLVSSSHSSYLLRLFRLQRLHIDNTRRQTIWSFFRIHQCENFRAIYRQKRHCQTFFYLLSITTLPILLHAYDFQL